MVPIIIKTLEATQLEEVFLKFHIYLTVLTSKLHESTIQNIVISDVSGSYDTLTDLESRTHYGRPNFGDVFTRLKSAFDSGANISFLYHQVLFSYTMHICLHIDGIRKYVVQV